MNSTYGIITPEVLKNRFSVIKSPGTYKVKVSNVSADMDSLSPINEGGKSRIINFRIIFKQDVAAISEMMKDALAEGKEGITYEEMGRLTASFNLEDTDPQFSRCPVRDEEVEVIVERIKVENKSGNSRHEIGSDILIIRNIKIKEGEPVPTTFNWDFAITEIEVESEEEETEVI